MGRRIEISRPWIRFVPVIASLLVVSSPAWAQAGKLTPRDLFYEPEAQAGKPAPEPSPCGDAARRPLSARYQLLRRTPEGSFLGVDPDATVFRSGDRVRVSIELNQPAYLYIVQHGSSGRWSTLFPSPNSAANNRIDARQPYSVPGASGSGFGFDERPGEERLFLIVSLNDDVPLPSLITVLNEGGTGSGRAAELARTMLRGMAGELVSRDLRIEKADEPAAGDGQQVAVYATPSQCTDSTLAVGIRLLHQQ